MARSPLSPIGDLLVVKLQRFMEPAKADAAVRACCTWAGVSPSQLQKADLPRLFPTLDASLGIALGSERRAEVIRSLRQWIAGAANVNPIVEPRTIPISTEIDVRDARVAALKMAEEIGFVQQDATKVATVVSELSRNALSYAGGGMIELIPERAPRRGIKILAKDDGPGIANLEKIFAGAYQSRQGLGLGLRGSKRIMDSFDVETKVGEGTRITAAKYVS